MNFGFVYSNNNFNSSTTVLPPVNNISLASTPPVQGAGSVQSVAQQILQAVSTPPRSQIKEEEIDKFCTPLRYYEAKADANGKLQLLVSPNSKKTLNIRSQSGVTYSIKIEVDGQIYIKRIRYTGLTIQPVLRRWKQHIRMANKKFGSQSYFYSKVRKHLSNPNAKFLFGVNPTLDRKLTEQEKMLIAGKKTLKGQKTVLNKNGKMIVQKGANSNGGGGGLAASKDQIPAKPDLRVKSTTKRKLF
jgi:hypothetical protein